MLRAVGFVEISAGAAQEASFTLPASAELSKLTLLMTLMTPVMTLMTPAVMAASATSAPPTPVVEPLLAPMADATLASAPAAADADADAADAAPAAAATAPPLPSSALTTTRLEEEAPPLPSSALTTARLEEAPSASQLRASKGGMTLTEAQVAALRRQKLVPRPELCVPRQLLVLRPGEGVAAPPPELREELPEDYFELTANDVNAMSLAGAPGGGAARSGASMQTKAMRELRQLEAMKEYSHALIRV